MLDFWLHIPAFGSLFNAGAVLVGGGVGLLVGRFIPARTHPIVFQCFGLFSLYLGFDMAWKTRNMLVVLASLATGAIAGELMDIDARLNSLGERLRSRVKIGGDTFTKGFVTATLLFCIGSMAILGAIEEGVKGDPHLLLTKGVMDGIVSVLFAASLGVGVLFSALPLLIYEGALTLAAGQVQAFITPAMIDNLSGTGGLMIVGLGLSMLKAAEIKTANLLPGLLFAVLLTAVIS